MATVRSVWPDTAIAVDGMLPASEWAGAGMLPVPAGWLLVKNDADSVYIALDLVGDNGNDPGDGDYYWFVIDIDNNSAVTPNRDMLYSPWPGQPNRLGRWMMAGPNTCWGAPNNQVIPSSNHVAFGPSPRSATNHRMWEMRLKLSELGITVDSTQPPPVIRFGLRVASTTPSFTYEYPASPMSAFNNFNQIILATAPTTLYPPGTAGAVIGGVGFIPATLIGADGYATITMPYRIMPDEAAFGGLIDLIGNTATLPALWAAGIRKYRVMHRSGNSVTDVNGASWAPIRQSWSNFRWTGLTYVWEPFAPDTNDMYPFVDPALDYSIKALLFEWTSTTFSNNLHQFQLQFFNAANAPVSAPPQAPVTLRLDNQLPTVKLVDILHNGVSVAPCAIETMADASDGLQFIFTAFDPEGDLHSYTLRTEYGAGNVTDIVSDSYPPHSVPTHIWQGVTNLTQPVSPGKWSPPYTCAYLFRISATARVTNGYDWPYGWVSDFRTVTLIKPGMKIALKPLPMAKELLPYGFADKGKIIKEGIEPKKLGPETRG